MRGREMRNERKEGLKDGERMKNVTEKENKL